MAYPRKRVGGGGGGGGGGESVLSTLLRTALVRKIYGISQPCSPPQLSPKQT